MPAEMESAPHRLFGYLDGRDPCSAAHWAGDAKAEIVAAHRQGRLPVLVGGTGLYIRSLLDGISPIPEIDPQIRADIRALETSEAWAQLEAEDADAAAALSPNDDSRIKRALEVKRDTGRSITEWRGIKSGGIGGDVTLRPVLLLPDRDWLYERCDRRFEIMLDDGALSEVEALLARNLPGDAPVMRAIGVPEISAMLRGEIDREEATALAQTATRQYAKRQYTWFRNQTSADWPHIEGNFDNKNIIDFVTLLQ